MSKFTRFETSVDDKVIYNDIYIWREGEREREKGREVKVDHVLQFKCSSSARAIKFQLFK